MKTSCLYVCILFIITILTAPLALAAPESMPATAMQTFNEINTRRVFNAKSLLAWDGATAMAAKDRALDMLTKSYFDHISPSGASLQDAMWEQGITDIRQAKPTE